MQKVRSLFGKRASEDFLKSILSDVKKHVDAAGGIQGIAQKVEQGLRKVAPKLKPGAEAAASGIEAARKAGAGLWKTIQGGIKKKANAEAFVNGFLDEIEKMR